MQTRKHAELALAACVIGGLVVLFGCSAPVSSSADTSAGGTHASGGSHAQGGGAAGPVAGASNLQAGAASGGSSGQGGAANATGAAGSASGAGTGGVSARGGTGGAAAAAGTSSGGSGGDSSAGTGGADSNDLTVGCGRPREQVSVGGVEGFVSFVDASHSAELRACGASLYIHQVGWGGVTEQERRQIAANFAGTGGISLEMAEATDLQTDYFDLGIASIDEILVNAPTCEVPEADMAVDVWQGWVTKWKALGITRAEYNDTPNCHFPVNWDDSKWDASKDRARIGGGVILDSPPFFYYDVGPADYRAFVRAEIAWANANGLHSSWILSPGGDRDFLAATQQLIAEINALPPEQRPQQWIVESYGAGGPVGDENVAGSVANVALWVVNNAQVYRP